MTRSTARDVAGALGILVQRSFRSRLYEKLTAGIGPGVDETTYPVLSGLERVGPCSSAELAGAIGLDRSGVSRRSSRLEEGGLLIRVSDPDDARATLLVLSENGKSAVSTMRRRLVDLIDASMEPWPEGQAEAFAAGLQRFVEDGPFR
jgi:DNA-binding MarR family transcriptional regulator